MKILHHIPVILLALAFLTFQTEIYAQPQKDTKKKTEIRKLTKEEFEKTVYDPAKDGDKAVYKGKTPCIIDFYADWCRPCKVLSPILEELQEEYKGKIIIYKVNTDEQRELAQLYGISAIPTLFFFPKNEKPVVMRGAPSKEELKKVIEEYLKP